MQCTVAPHVPTSIFCLSKANIILKPPLNLLFAAEDKQRCFLTLRGDSDIPRWIVPKSIRYKFCDLMFPDAASGLCLLQISALGMLVSSSSHMYLQFFSSIATHYCTGSTFLLIRVTRIFYKLPEPQSNNAVIDDKIYHVAQASLFS